ncbi:MAG TPA: OmpA family protein [Acidimicrobiales bacterium]|nr:OmpA family protein [Acidimicrobiales bacterium]
MIDHDGVGIHVIDRRIVELPARIIVGGRVVDPQALAEHLDGIVGAARGPVVAAWWPDDALLTTIDCTGASRGNVGEVVDRVVVDRFGARRPSVVLRSVRVAGRDLITVGACWSPDLENAHRALQLCGLDRASLIFAPAALAILTRDFAAPAVLAVGSTRVGVLYGFAGWPLVGGSLTSDAREPVAQVFGVSDVSMVQHRSLRPPMAHREKRVFGYSAMLESIARVLRADSASNGNGAHGELTDPLLEDVPGDYLVALAAALWGATAVADLVPSALPAQPGIAAVANDAAAQIAVDPVQVANDKPGTPVWTGDRPLPRRRARELVAAAILALLLVGGGLWLANSDDDSADPPLSAAAVSTSTSAGSSLAGSSAPVLSATVPATTAPFVAQPHFGVYWQGKLYLEGTLPSRADADAFVRKASAVIGPQNVVDNYVIDARAPAPSSGFVRIEDLQFRDGSDVLDEEYFGVVELGVIVMNQNEHARMIITGHTDSVGDEEGNQLLSVRRANAIVNYMAWRGIARSRLVAVGKGETSPIADNATEAGRKLNRRIEVELLGLLDI